LCPIAEDMTVERWQHGNDLENCTKQPFDFFDKGIQRHGRQTAAYCLAELYNATLLH
jgi:hypothetical protein